MLVRHRRRRCTLAAVAALALLVAVPATHARPSAGQEPRAVIPQTLLDAARANPKAEFDVIVQGDGSERSAQLADRIAKELAKDAGLGSQGVKEYAAAIADRFSSIDGVTVRLSGKDIERLARKDGIHAITPDAPVQVSAWSNKQKWPTATRVKWYWGSSYAKLAPATIAIVDSGIDPALFGSRLLTQVDLVSQKGASKGPNSPGDGRGHGTMVASLAGVSDPVYDGVAPTARLVSLDVVNDAGGAVTGDVIRAADWILANKEQYGIRVANFSLHSSVPSSFLYDPLDRAVERLWHSGVVVVTSAGNYAVAGQPSGVLYAPANDPFVITVGAVDINASDSTGDDLAAPWSAYGYTLDGFAKPDLGAPGRYLIGHVPPGATLQVERPGNTLPGNYMQLSGTSFAAPIVAAAAAALLGAHPDWTPDQVKGVLMVGAAVPGRATSRSLGVGELNVEKSFRFTGTPPNPNLGLNAFLVTDSRSGATVFDAASWTSAASSSASWSSASWTSASWSSASWSSASWSSASWNSASWTSASWSSASWSSAGLDSAAVDYAASDGLGTG
jgi:serine protease AprX